MAELTEIELVRRNEVFTTVVYSPQIIRVENIPESESSSVAVKSAGENLPKQSLLVAKVHDSSSFLERVWVFSVWGGRAREYVHSHSSLVEFIIDIFKAVF